MVKLNQASLNHLKESEGCRLTAYLDTVGVWTIGYGFTFPINGVRPHSGMTITQKQADDLLNEYIPKYQTFLKYFNTSFNDNQVGALTSFEWNLGSGIWYQYNWDKNLPIKDFPKQMGLYKQPPEISGRRDREIELFQRKVSGGGNNSKPQTGGSGNGGKPIKKPKPDEDKNPPKDKPPKPVIDLSFMKNSFEELIKELGSILDTTLNRSMYDYNNADMLSNGILMLRKTYDKYYSVGLTKGFNDIMNSGYEKGRDSIYDKIDKESVKPKPPVIEQPNKKPKPPTNKPTNGKYIFPLQNSKYIGFQLNGQQYGWTGWVRPNSDNDYHNGVDFGTSHYPNRNIVAVTDGVIHDCGFNDYAWAFIVLKVGDLYIHYQEFSEHGGNLNVVKGQNVKQGDVIGYKDSFHLHFGITRQSDYWIAMNNWNRDNGTWIDPINLITQGKCKGNVMKPSNNCFG